MSGDVILRADPAPADLDDVRLPIAAAGSPALGPGKREVAIAVIGGLLLSPFLR